MKDTLTNVILLIRRKKQLFTAANPLKSGRKKIMQKKSVAGSVYYQGCGGMIT